VALFLCPKDRYTRQPGYQHSYNVIEVFVQDFQAYLTVTEYTMTNILQGFNGSKMVEFVY